MECPCSEEEGTFRIGKKPGSLNRVRRQAAVKEAGAEVIWGLSSQTTIGASSLS